jgi:hypothetical protein
MFDVKKIALQIALALLVYGAGSAQAQTSAECGELFKRVTDKVRSLRLISAKNSFQLVAYVTITPEKGPVVQESMEIVALGNRYRLKTNQYSLYQDEKTMIVVQHDQKSIFMTKPLPEKQRQNQFAEMMRIQDSLQQQLQIKGCSREFGTIQPNTGFTKIIFASTKKLEKMGYKSVAYWVHAETAEVKKISMDYLPGSTYKMKRYELVIEKMNTSAAEEPFKGEAAAQVMNRKGQLKSEFSSYQVVDKRN